MMNNIEHLVYLLVDNKNVSYDNKLFLLTTLEKYKIISSKLSELDDKNNYTIDSVQKEYEKLMTVIQEIAKIIGIDLQSNNSFQTIALYNYMQLFLSNKYETIFLERSQLLGYLKTSKLHPKFIKDNTKNKEICKLVSRVIRKLRIEINNYNNLTNPELRSKNLDLIIGLLKKSFKEIIDKLAERNLEIIRSIRNAVDHGNLSEIAGDLQLKDYSNQLDSSSEIFKCHGTLEDFFEITEHLELGTAKQSFKFEDFLTELKYILMETDSQNNQKLYVEYVEILNEIRQLLGGSLINILTEISYKKR